MGAAKGGAVSRVGGGEGGAILKSGKTYAPASGHGDGDAPCHNNCLQTKLGGEGARCQVPGARCQVASRKGLLIRLRYQLEAA